MFEVKSFLLIRTFCSNEQVFEGLKCFLETREDSWYFKKQTPDSFFCSNSFDLLRAGNIRNNKICHQAEKAFGPSHQPQQQQQRQQQQQKQHQQQQQWQLVQ